jgi:GR25 family glycosyltransferase involved in LPS biosynthesis
MKAFIIRLKENDWSIQVSDDCIDQAKKFNLQIQAFDGVYGQDADSVFHDEKVKKFVTRRKKMMLLGVKGCAASHFLLWKKCLELNESLIILEHDAFMINPLPNDIEDQFEEICKLDKHNPFLETYEQNILTDQEQNVIDYQTTWGYKENFAPYGGYFLGAWSYIIKPIAAEKLVNSFKENGWLPADKQLGENLLKLQTTNQTVFRLHPSYNHKNIREKSLTKKLI